MEHRLQSEEQRTPENAEERAQHAAVGGSVGNPSGVVESSGAESGKRALTTFFLGTKEGTTPQLADPGAMLPQEREVILTMLAQQVGIHKRWRQWSLAIYSIGVTLFIGLNIAYVLGYLPYISAIMFPLIAIYALAGAIMNRAEHRLGRTEMRIAQFDDVRATGPLLEALGLRDKAVVNVAEKALVRLLPRLQANDASLITETQRECLYKRLTIENARTSTPFLVAALKALEQIGDASAIPCVEKLISSSRISANATMVRNAARNCLPFLKFRAEQKQLSDSLLRASSCSATPSDTLLRAASAISSSDSDQLLRGSTRNEEGVE